ncbi:sulfatase-like hydrolase/transferase [Desulfobacterales bacterium]|nr:sulfatase-like hydrolase/transferase [Desulfobacterales bacterium]
MFSLACIVDGWTLSTLHWPRQSCPYRKSEHLDKDLADRAIEWITGHKSIKSNLPFMMLWASGSMHSPHHAPDSYLDKYKGKFDMGWDNVREKILKQQIAKGVVPAGTKLTKRIDHYGGGRNFGS